MGNLILKGQNNKVERIEGKLVFQCRYSGGDAANYVIKDLNKKKDKVKDKKDKKKKKGGHAQTQNQTNSSANLGQSANQINTNTDGTVVNATNNVSNNLEKDGTQDKNVQAAANQPDQSNTGTQNQQTDKPPVIPDNQKGGVPATHSEKDKKDKKDKSAKMKYLHIRLEAASAGETNRCILL